MLNANTAARGHRAGGSWGAPKVTVAARCRSLPRTVVNTAAKSAAVL